MIVINKGIFSIPDEDRFIGHVGDNLHVEKQFLVKDMADEDCIYRLYLTFDNGATNYFVLDSKVENGSTTLTWKIEEDHLIKNGLVKAQLKVFFDEEETAHSSYDYFFVGSSAEFNEDFFDKENSEFLDYEKKLNELLEQIKNGEIIGYVKDSRKIAGIDLVDDITAQELREALKVYSVMYGKALPSGSTKAKEGTLYICEDHGSLHYCYSDTPSYTFWREIFANSAKKIAGIPMSKNISDIELKDSLGIYSIRFIDEEPDVTTQGKLREMVVCSAQDGNPKTYICTDVTDGIYQWLKIADINSLKEANGVVFTPTVSEDGVLSWSNDGGLTNPEPVKIKFDEEELGLINDALESIIAIQENLIGGALE